MNHLKLL